jgi:hypothetical protein
MLMLYCQRLERLISCLSRDMSFSIVCNSRLSRKLFGDVTAIIYNLSLLQLADKRLK